MEQEKTMWSLLREMWWPSIWHGALHMLEKKFHVGLQRLFQTAVWVRFKVPSWRKSRCSCFTEKCTHSFTQPSSFNHFFFLHLIQLESCSKTISNWEDTLFTGASLPSAILTTNQQPTGSVLHSFQCYTRRRLKFNALAKSNLNYPG